MLQPLSDWITNCKSDSYSIFRSRDDPEMPFDELSLCECSMYVDSVRMPKAKMCRLFMPDGMMAPHVFYFYSWIDAII